MTDFSFEEISVFLPKWLSPTEQTGLFSELKRLPSNIAFYDQRHEFDHDALQGDGWRGLVAIDFYSLQKKPVSGVIISNSCDIDTANRRDVSPNVLFAPIIRLSKFADMLASAKRSPEEIADRLDVIRAQRVTSLFYLPKHANVIDESLILLDDIHRHPLQDFARVNRQKLFTMTQTAFYLFLIKLSIHFNRVNERVHRYIP
jgi:hypothetical protein